ncbi:sn-glycerol-3-phosphate transport system permease protein UgpE [Longispora fulva]|uniref:ABC-type glycerol-3-phosphate transport system permease component n=1 Tax=Longispora fulva TaxID=619741 RepID=A0A8J7GGQ0_9ACTN|nr:carbohydrate ABC transporter permease [Longispora fulva]MBG6134039.1 ABC-type glycerol-3-phosphate transport system permease component [Longispora fulva]GIG63557.1 sn-glycerol-3-phosphate transport system permease protein UgpE [Longispora fulva]
MTTPTSPLRLLRQRRRHTVATYVILGVGSVLWLFPMITAVRASVAYGGVGNYLTVLTGTFNGVSLPRTFLNSFLVAALHAFLVCSVGSLAGYAFSKIRFPGRETLYYGVLIFLAVPAVAILVPVYWITGQLALFNTHLGVALPEAALTLPFAVLLLRNYADGIPNELIEAASMDGAGHGRVYKLIFLPLARPALVNLAALSVMWSLQDFLFPSTILKKSELTTAAQAVQTIQSGFGPSPTQTSQYFAALVLLAVPALVLVVTGLRFITSGITQGGVKE